jgi:hypothetical protein
LQDQAYNFFEDNSLIKFQLVRFAVNGIHLTLTSFRLGDTIKSSISQRGNIDVEFECVFTLRINLF